AAACGFPLSCVVILPPPGSPLFPYTTLFRSRYRTPWGLALNFDGAMSDHVRRYFIDGALYYVSQCHIDALRVDAVHSIVDASATDWKSTRLNSSHVKISYAVFCLKKKTACKA